MSRERVLAWLLILALILCHGVYGSMHLTHDPLVSPAMESGDHAASSHSVHATHETSASARDKEPVPHHGGMSAEYFAVFLTLVFGLIYSVFLFLRSAKTSPTLAASLRAKAFLPIEVFRPPARDLTLARLQVFRL